MKSNLLVLLAFICLIGAVTAQEREVMRGPIHGRVMDASSRPVPGVQVTLGLIVAPPAGGKCEPLRRIERRG